MASITSPGVGSGLDVNGIISKLMAVEQAPVTKLDKQEASYQAKLSAYGTLKGTFASLQSAAAAMTSVSLYASKAASSSDTTVLTSSANTAAKAGKYVVDVVTTAKAHSIASTAFPSFATDLSTVDSKLRIELGTFDGGTYTPDPDHSAVTIDIPASASSLEEVRDAINDANAGVRANLVYVGSEGYKLTLTSTDTGAKNSIRLTALDSTGTVTLNDNTELAQLSFDPEATTGAGKEFSVSTVAGDTHLKIDGLDVYRSSTTISDAITGVTISAIKAGSSTVTVAQDTTTVTNTVAAFVKAYNEANSQLREFTAYNVQSKQGALLFGDTTARSLQTSLNNMVNYVMPGAGSGLSRLSDLGISKQRDGSLEFKASTFSAALEKSPTDIATLMTSTTAGSQGLATYFNSALKDLTSTSGIFASRTDGINRSISDLTSQRERLGLRLEQIEKRYRAQFSALDTLVASMQQTSQYLTQQLANLPSTSSS